MRIFAKHHCSWDVRFIKSLGLGLGLGVSSVVVSGIIIVAW